MQHQECPITALHHRNVRPGMFCYVASDRDAILPAFSGFPDFSLVQCENEIQFSFF